MESESNFQDDSAIDDENRVQDSSCYTHVSFDNPNSPFSSQNFTILSSNGTPTTQSLYTTVDTIKQEEGFSLG